jgi:hypothetical protein
MTTFQFMNQLPDMAFKSQSSSEKQSCIRKIVVGHQPRGDATLVLDNFKGLQVLCSNLIIKVLNAYWNTSGIIDLVMRHFLCDKR